MTLFHLLHWNILEWNFDVERVDGILKRTVEHRGSMVRLPIWCYSAQKSHLKGEAFGG